MTPRIPVPSCGAGQRRFFFRGRGGCDEQRLRRSRRRRRVVGAARSTDSDRVATRRRRRRPPSAARRSRTRGSPSRRGTHRAITAHAARPSPASAVAAAVSGWCRVSLSIAEQRRGHEDRRVGAGDHADQQGEGELLAASTAPSSHAPMTSSDSTGRTAAMRRVHRAHQHLVHRHVHDVGVRRPRRPTNRALVLLAPVEHDDRVVERVAEDREEGDDGRRGDLEAEHRVHADADDHVVHHRHDRGHRHSPLEADRDVNGDQHEEHDERA